MQANSHREVWFIRHGESVGNAGERTREAPSYPLSALGFRQAEQLAGALHAEPDLIVVSPYVRAQQTAEPAIRRFANARVEEWPVQEVQYLDPLLCVDTTQDERRALSEEYWQRGDPHHAAPGAESFVEFSSRIGDVIEHAAQRVERRIFVFCHGQVMQAIAWLSVSRPAVMDAAAMRRFYNFMHGVSVPNCAILPLHHHADGSRTLAGLWVPEGVEAESAARNRAGQAGV
jgi:2,3-bisphosphoglycerate-dependent phosphoglycerate mutase